MATMRREEEKEVRIETNIFFMNASQGQGTHVIASCNSFLIGPTRRRDFSGLSRESGLQTASLDFFSGGAASSPDELRPLTREELEIPPAPPAGSLNQYPPTYEQAVSDPRRLPQDDVLPRQDVFGQESSSHADGAGGGSRTGKN